jgi:hypothetical protein
MVLVAPEHACRIVWKAEEDSSTADVDEEGEDDDDRMFSFEVAKTKEQDEDVQSKPGFVVSPPKGPDTRLLICIVQYHYGADQHSPSIQHADVEPDRLRPFVVHGDTSIGYGTISYVAPLEENRRLDESMSSFKMKDYVCVFDQVVAS